MDHDNSILTFVSFVDIWIFNSNIKNIEHVKFYKEKERLTFLKYQFILLDMIKITYWQIILGPNFPRCF